MALIDLTGQTFGQVTVRGKVPRPEGLKVVSSFWLCVCSCGATFVANGTGLRAGETKACKECRQVKHGMTGSPEYIAWIAMKRRCYNPNNPSRKWYGSLGIEVCERWRDSFEAFYSDMGAKPTGTSLDRKNGKLGYSPENCRWATPKQQQRNKSSNVLMAIKGVAKPISEWAEEYGLSRTLVWKRHIKWGWSAERSLSPPRSK